MLIRHERIVDWINVIREHPNNYRILENFWESQLKSKSWLIETLQNIIPKNISGNVYVFGGWYGILSQLLVDTFPNIHVYSIDKDNECENIGKKLSNYDDRISFITDSMETFYQYNNAILVINTSTEHITQNIFDKWLSNLPKDALLVLQGNNFFSCDEHIRCSETLEDFIGMNHITNIVYSDLINCNHFQRFMIIGKNI